MAKCFDYSYDRLLERVKVAEDKAERAIGFALAGAEYSRHTVNEHCRELQALNDLWQHYDHLQRLWLGADSLCVGESR